MFERDGGDPEFDEQRAAMYRIVKAALEAPPDAETAANLEKMQRRQEDLEALSRKQVAEISPDEALRLVWERSVQYPDAAEYFEKWWNSLDAHLQKKINIAAEGFRDLNDYTRRWLSADAVVLNAPYYEHAYPAFIASLPRITEPLFWALKNASAVNKRTDSRPKRRGAGELALKQLFVKVEVDKYLNEMRSALNVAFKITQGRQKLNTDRDRKLSQWRYTGMSLLNCAKKWNAERKLKREVSITPSLVKKAVDRYRLERQSLMWTLRVWIYQSKFPPLR